MIQRRSNAATKQWCLRHFVTIREQHAAKELETARLPLLVYTNSKARRVGNADHAPFQLCGPNSSMASLLPHPVKAFGVCRLSWHFLLLPQAGQHPFTLLS